MVKYQFVFINKNLGLDLIIKQN